MTSSTTTITPDTTVPGVVAVAEHTTHPATTLDSAARSEWTTTDDLQSALDRMSRPDYWTWLGHIGQAAGCTQPVRLAGQVRELDVDTTTGRVHAETVRSTADMPDGVIYKACGNRRAASCPACAEIYRQDAYQLVLAGLKGGKGVPEAVGGHPAVFMTLTAPSFGVVHTTRTTKHGQPAPCRARRRPDRCLHGIDQRCNERHQAGDERLGTPLCPDCYDYQYHAVWNVHASELWRRTTITANRVLHRFARDHGHLVAVPNGTTPTGEPRWKHVAPVRVSFGKVAEFQKRGLIHFHILARLDGIDPHDRDAVIEPPTWANAFLLTWVLRQAVEHVTFVTPGLVVEDPDTGHHEVNQPGGWPLRWGSQADIRPVRLRGDDPLTDERVTAELDPSTRRRKLLSGPAVAGYLAKYATKATEDTGHTSQRLTAETVDCYTTDTHVGRLVAACWQLGTYPRTTTAENPNSDSDWSRTRYPALRRWAHMLGYGGHFFTKSRRYTVTFKQLRQARVDYQRRQHRQRRQHQIDGPVHLEFTISEPAPDDTGRTLVHIAELTYVGRGWHNTGDALLANATADLARIRRQTAKEELASIARSA